MQCSASSALQGNEPEGLAVLYESSKQWFPLDFGCFVQLNISLASASPHSAQQVSKDALIGQIDQLHYQ